tara:strand:+ start:8538 stop:8747 length:210 start_codon:yes stop_codon:yes gene_type:complete
MKIKIGDLVYIKQHSYADWRHNNEIWLVIGVEPREKGQFKGFIRVQNIHNGNRVQCNEGMLMKVHSDKK